MKKLAVFALLVTVLLAGGCARPAQPVETDAPDTIYTDTTEISVTTEAPVTTESPVTTEPPLLRRHP